MIKRGIEIEPFSGAELVVATGERDQARLCELFNIDLSGGPLARGWVHVMHFRSGGSQLVVALPEKRCESTLYHEALHAACELMQMHGVPVDYEGQEMLCYLQEYVVRQIDKAVYTKRRGQRKSSVTK